MTRRLAIIDLGTNTFHLMIADMSGNSFTIIHREHQTVKIGQGGINDGLLPDDGMERALNALIQFKSMTDEFLVHEVKAIGTSAIRNASNRVEFIDRVEKATGIYVDVISGDQEAEYIYFGILAAMTIGTAKSLIIDIGGGSVECIICDDTGVLWKASFEIGGQRLLEKFQKHDPITAEEMYSMREYFHEQLQPLAEAVRVFQPTAMIGSSGSFDTLSEIYCAKNNISVEPDAPETPLTIEAFDAIHQELIKSDRDGRMLIPGMIEMRVDLIVVGSSLIRYLLDSFSFNHIRVSSYSLKEGVLYHMWKKKKTPE